MKNILIGSVILLSAASLTASAEEFSWGNVTFQPRAYAGYADYQLDSGTFTFHNEGDPTNKFTAPLNFDVLGDHHKLQFSGLIGGIGGTVAFDQFFGDFYYQSTLNEVAYSSYSLTNQPEENITVNSYIGDINAQHADWAMSLGYMITDQWSVFAGYKSGNTDWDQSASVRVSDTNLDISATQDGKLNGKFDQDGPFLGTSYSFPIGPGALTFKAAYAYLDGNFKWDFNSTLDGSAFRSRSYKMDGNSNAYSLGISWTQSLADNLGYSIGANYHRYKFDLSGISSATQAGSLLPIQIFTGGSLTEDLFTLTASLFYRF